MSGLFATIVNSSRAVIANQRALQVISHNVANVNSEGYHRQEIVLRAGVPVMSGEVSWTGGSVGMLGTGVIEDSIKRYTNDFLDKLFRSETAESAKWNYKGEILGQVETAMSEMNDGGLIKKLDNFWDAWQVLSSDPTSDAMRSVVRDTGKDLADAFNRRMVALDEIYANQDVALQERVLEINAIADKIVELNKQVGHMINSGQQPNDLLDQRDRLLDRLAEVAGSVSFSNTWIVDQATGRTFDSGHVNVSIGGHTLVASGSGAAKLVYNQGTGIVSWEDGQPYTGYNGEITGIIEARQVIKEQIDGLNKIAHGVIKWVNDVHQTTYQTSDPVSVANVDVPLNITGGNFWLGGNGVASVGTVTDPAGVLNPLGPPAAASPVLAGLRELGTMTYTLETRSVGGQLQFRLKDGDNNVVPIDDGAGLGNLTTEWRNYVGGTVYDTQRGLTITFSNPPVYGQDVKIDYVAAGIDLTNAATVGAGNEIDLAGGTDTLSSIASKINASKLLQPEGREVEAIIVGGANSYQLLLVPVKAGTNHAVIANSTLTTTGVVPPDGNIPAGALLTFPSSVAVATPSKFFDGDSPSDDQLGAARLIRLNENIKSDLSNITASISNLAPGDGRIAYLMAEGRTARNFEQGANGIMANANDRYNTQLTQFGLTLNYAASNKQEHAVISKALTDQREGFIGVSLDEEAVNLLKYQKAFQAAAKIISVADEMLGRIIDGLKT